MNRVTQASGLRIPQQEIRTFQFYITIGNPVTTYLLQLIVCFIQFPPYLFETDVQMTEVQIIRNVGNGPFTISHHVQG
ncbi:hypothetical protein BDZ94DRAFT_1266570 [Collybia nuda]|uniref:Uncharacterized protein n=1 Tax=Collybia nuda TaxID=64659 RepID=A0A9P5Y0M8_9AGAR|nr:hypothetical protein BDZ94DRAFT_1266570 [Collybia nuda]